MTTFNVISTSKTESHYEQVTQLDGRAFILNFNWIQRVGRWSLDVFTENREPIALGQYLVANSPVYKRIKDSRMWFGVMTVVSTSGVEPSLTNFFPDGDVFLCYIPIDTVLDLNESLGV